MERLIGNESLLRRLDAAVQSGKLPHSFLICGPDGSGKHTLARHIAAALQCRGDNAPCFICAQCRKVLQGVHPDVITVDDPEKKTVSVAMARDAKNDVYVRPNEGKKKIYVFPRAQDMNAQAQNALLKIIEEPPEYGVFLLLTDRAERLLPTIRSRCAEFTLAPVAEADAVKWLREKHPEASVEALAASYRESGGFLGQAEAILAGATLDGAIAAMLQAYASGDKLALTQAIWKLQSYKRDAFVPALTQAETALAAALKVKSGVQAQSDTARMLAQAKPAAELLQAYRDLQEMRLAAERNVGVGHICGCMAARLR